MSARLSLAAVLGLALSLGVLGCTSDPDDTGDPSVGLSCDALIECVKVADPGSLSAFAGMYADGGTCYSTPGLTAEDCWAECEAQRKVLAGQNSSVAECGPPNCGNDKLDADEECDGTPGCGAACTFTAGTPANQCNPVNNLPCSGKCGREFTSTGQDENTWFFWCEPAPVAPSVELGGACSSNDDCIDETATCYGDTCKQACYLGPTDESYGCTTGTCVAWPDIHGDAWAPGSEYFGICM